MLKFFLTGPSAATKSHLLPFRLVLEISWLIKTQPFLRQVERAWVWRRTLEWGKGFGGVGFLLTSAALRFGQ